MNIGFDAKRAFHNTTGLGNYSRTLIQSLSSFYPNEQYYVFNPKKKSAYNFSASNIHEINPSGILPQLFPSLWRSRFMVQDIDKHVDLYHGLSNELPFGIHHSKVKKVVTIHDLIFEYFPEQYNKNDVLIYRKKFKYACEHADKIIAISESTKKDLINLYAIPEHKIEVCYQSCDERFYTCSTAEHAQKIREKYQLHTPYFLSVGSIIERKNLLQICNAFYELHQENNIQLVVIGKGNGAYKQKITAFIETHNLSAKIIFLEDSFSAHDIQKDMPALYQNAIALVYPSVMEGFGIPVLEAMASGTPVITSNVSSLPEVGGDAVQCIQPHDTNELFLAMKRLIFDTEFKHACSKKGIERAQLFTNQKTCEHVMNMYKQLNLNA